MTKRTIAARAYRPPHYGRYPFGRSMQMSYYTHSWERGFSTLELTVVATVSILLTVMAVPSITSALRNYRSVGDGRSLTEAVSVAKIRAAADFTESRVYADLSLNKYRVEMWPCPCCPRAAFPNAGSPMAINIALPTIRVPVRPLPWRSRRP